jgi:hypothetical protein
MVVELRAIVAILIDEYAIAIVLGNEIAREALIPDRIRPSKRGFDVDQRFHSVDIHETIVENASIFIPKPREQSEHRKSRQSCFLDGIFATIYI